MLSSEWVEENVIGRHLKPGFFFLLFCVLLNQALNQR